MPSGFVAERFPDRTKAILRRNAPHVRPSPILTARFLEILAVFGKLRLSPIAFGNQTISAKSFHFKNLLFRDSWLCVPASRQVCLYRVQSLAKEHLLPKKFRSNSQKH